jgi:hypothetical protein
MAELRSQEEKEAFVTSDRCSKQGDWGTIYKQDETVVARDIVGETILVPIRGKLADLQRIFALNEVGAYIWSKLDGESTLESICDDLQMEFDVSRELAERDMSEFIDELLEMDLIMGIKSK